MSAHIYYHCIDCLDCFGLPEGMRLIDYGHSCGEQSIRTLTAFESALVDQRNAALDERDALRLEVERNGEAIKLVADQADAWRLERDALRAALQEISDCRARKFTNHISHADRCIGIARAALSANEGKAQEGEK